MNNQIGVFYVIGGQTFHCVLELLCANILIEVNDRRRLPTDSADDTDTKLTVLSLIRKCTTASVEIVNGRVHHGVRKAS